MGEDHVHHRRSWSVEDDDGVGLEATGKLMGEEKIMTSKRTCVMEEKLGPERVRRYWLNQEAPGKLKCEVTSNLENAVPAILRGNDWKLAWILPYLLPQAFLNFILPAGFPGSVSDDYIYYMLWQFPSLVTGWASNTIVTSSLLKALGIGADPATAGGATAAIKWITKDGLGALGRIFIGGRFGSLFDEDPKQWGMYGDILASFGSVLDLLTPVFPQRFLVLASLGYLLQAMGRGLAAPSNQVVHTHFAISENVGDVLAKEEVWTVAAELCGLALGVCILAAPGMMTYWKLALTWVVLRIVHLYIRYMCLATLRLYTINYKRAQLLIVAHIKGFPVPGRHECNKMESVIMPSSLIAPRVQIGSSFQNLLGSQPLTQEVEDLLKVYDAEKYLLFLHQNLYHQLEARVLFKEDCSSLTILRSMYQASLLLLPNLQNGEEMQAFLESGRLENIRENPDEMICTDKNRVVSLRGQGSRLIKSLHTMQQQFDSFVRELEEVGWDLNKIVLRLPSSAPLLSQV